MLAKIEIELDKDNLNVSMGSLFHGYLMRSINPAYADYLHYNQINPFTSCVYFDKEKNKYIWRVTTFNEEAYNVIIRDFLEKEIKDIYLEKKDLEIKINATSTFKTSFDRLFSDKEFKSKIKFITPTAFKSNNEIQIFPNISTLLKGVVNKINLHSDTVKFEDEKIMDDLISRVFIRKYNLRSHIFNLEKTKVNGFVGDVVVGIKGNDHAFKDILNILLSVSEYTGLGIKTSLGMGGIKNESE